MQTTSNDLLQHDRLFCAVDIVGFSAQAIAAYHPHYRGQPLVVINQQAQSHKSAVISCSPQAQSMGISCGMPLYQIMRTNKNIIIVEKDPQVEEAARDELMCVFEEYSPMYVIAANGSCLLDLSRTPVSRSMAPCAVGNALHASILKALPLNSLAIGMAAQAPAARIMARCARPTGICVCDAGAEEQTIATHGVGALPGLSGVCRAKLKAYGIKRIAQIQSFDRTSLQSHFGNEGDVLFGLVHGLAGKPMLQHDHEIVAQTVLPNDINNNDVLLYKVGLTVDKLCFNLKNAGWCIDRFTMTLTYSDNKRAQKTIILPQPTNDFLHITKPAHHAFCGLYQRRIALKSITLHARNPQKETGQLDLFTSEWDNKQEALSKQITKVRNVMDFNSVMSASAFLE